MRRRSPALFPLGALLLGAVALSLTGCAEDRAAPVAPDTEAVRASHAPVTDAELAAARVAASGPRARTW